MTGTIEIRPLTGAIGAEIVGVDLSGEISNQQFDAIHQAWLDYLVIYFRNQNLTPQQHRDFAARFSALEAHPYVESIEEVPEIIAIVKEPDEHRNWGGPWHADVTFKPKPSNGAALYALEVPEFGGDTGFANLYLAYETLSDGLKGVLAGLRAVHSSHGMDYYDGFKGMNAKAGIGDESTHPVVITHPQTGRKALYVNRLMTEEFVGLAPGDSDALLTTALSHAENPDHVYEHAWQAGDLVMWDNRCTQHARKDFPGTERRLLRRVGLEGDRPY